MKMVSKDNYVIAVMGVGYVGMPLINELARKCKVIAYDINDKKVKKLRYENVNSNIFYTSNEDKLKQADIIIVCVPTPIDNKNRPCLKYIDDACEIIGRNIKKGSLVIFESSVMPTCTEKHCIPLLENYSGLKCNCDFYVGYSPERINPGDSTNTLGTIIKLISASSDEVLDLMEEVYSNIDGITLFRIKNIKVAEMSKLLENCQRDINIALMNELSKLCHKIDIDINDVIEAASTKWNFMPYYPGLVGGDCVGVNSYYLMSLAEEYNETLSLLQKARDINLDVPKFIVNQLNQLVKKVCIMDNYDKSNINVAIYGYSYKENVADIRNTRVAELYNELVNDGYNVKICDYNIDDSELRLHICDQDLLANDIVILAVPHDGYSKWGKKEILEKFDSDSNYKIFMDLKSRYSRQDIPDDIMYWSL